MTDGPHNNAPKPRTEAEVEGPHPRAARGPLAAGAHRARWTRSPLHWALFVIAVVATSRAVEEWARGARIYADPIRPEQAFAPLPGEAEVVERLARLASETGKATFDDMFGASRTPLPPYGAGWEEYANASRAEEARKRATRGKAAFSNPFDAAWAELTGGTKDEILARRGVTVPLANPTSPSAAPATAAGAASVAPPAPNAAGGEGMQSGSKRTIEFLERLYEFPADATGDEVVAALRASAYDDISFDGHTYTLLRGRDAEAIVKDLQRPPESSLRFAWSEVKALSWLTVALAAALGFLVQLRRSRRTPIHPIYRWLATVCATVALGSAVAAIGYWHGSLAGWLSAAAACAGLFVISAATSRRA